MSFVGEFARHACVVTIGVKTMAPTIVQHDGATLDVRDIGRDSGICLILRRRGCDSRGAVGTVVGTVEPSLLGSELASAFHVFLVEVFDEIWKGMLCLRTFAPVATSLCEQAGVLEYL